MYVHTQLQRNTSTYGHDMLVLVLSILQGICMCILLPLTVHTIIMYINCMLCCCRYTYFYVSVCISSVHTVHLVCFTHATSTYALTHCRRRQKLFSICLPISQLWILYSPQRWLKHSGHCGQMMVSECVFHVPMNTSSMILLLSKCSETIS